VTRAGRVGVIVGAALTALVALGFTAELVRSNFVQDDLRANYVTLPLAALLFALLIATWLVLIRPRSEVGWLLGAGTAGSGAGFWRFSTHPWCAVVGLVAFYASILLPLHAALVQGIGIGRAARRVLTAAHAAVALLGMTIAVTAPAGALDRWFVAADQRRHVTNELLLFSSHGVARAAQAAWWVVVLLAATVGATSRVRRWYRAPRRSRRLETPIVVGVIIWVVAMTAGGLVMFVRRVPVARASVADYAAVILPTVTLALLAGVIAWVELVAPRIARREGSVAMPEVDRTGLRALLADLLASPHVDVAYANGDGWVDGGGVSIDVVADRRHHTLIDVNGADVAVVLHERDVPVDAVQLAARITAAQFEAERATALARARAEAVRAATAELVRAGDRAAMAVASELLAGPLPELVDLARRVRSGETSTADAGETLRAVTAQVRQVSHGLLPRALESGGLGPALGARAAVARRLPHAVEVTVYLLAHDDPTATVRDETDTIVVTRSSAPGAEGAARTAALGGRIDGTVATLPVN
jgi:hypothetical protein